MNDSMYTRARRRLGPAAARVSIAMTSAAPTRRRQAKEARAHARVPPQRQLPVDGRSDLIWT